MSDRCQHCGEEILDDNPIVGRLCVNCGWIDCPLDPNSWFGWLMHKTPQLPWRRYLGPVLDD